MAFRLCLVCATLWLAAPSWAELPKQIFAHYMGCCPVATGPQYWNHLQEAKTVRHDGPDETARHGGHVRNWDLTPWGLNLTAEQSADLEIRRALRIGLDGFAVDAWAGGNDARRSLDALFKVAEDHDYPFAVTVCIDPSCGGNPVDTVKYLLDKHGRSPKLARRDGKPLVFGYQSVWPGLEALAKQHPGASAAETARLRTSPEGWEAIGAAYEEAAHQLGQPIYWHFGLGAFFYGVDAKQVPKDGLSRAAGVLAKHVQALGAFTSLGPDEADAARAVKAAGAEWVTPLGMFQKENVPWETYGGKGLDWMWDNWQRAREQDARLLQLVTWNDYGENSNLAPAYNTRYTLYDLTGYFIAWWKTGREPAPDHDRVYLVSRKYPPGVKVFPFRQGPYRDGALEVVTILTAPATIRLPGRGAEYEAPKGFYRRQFPVTPGPVAAELRRDGALVLKLESPEPITDRPFREDNALTCFSTEFARHWRADFGEAKPLLWSEYGDPDGSGLPNWFKMYWFGKFGDLTTATGVDPKALAPSGKMLLQEYLDQTDPTHKPIPYTELPRTGLLAWYRADQGVVADADGRVAAWQDQSGHQLHLTARTAAEQPRLRPNVWNGLPALELDGVHHSLYCALPNQALVSMTVVAVYGARPEEQVCRIQEGVNNRLVSIPTTHKADYEGGIALGVSGIERPGGDVAVATRVFAPGEQPLGLGLGYMVVAHDAGYRNWNFRGRVAEVLVYAPALSESDARKVVSILKARYGL